MDIPFLTAWLGNGMTAWLILLALVVLYRALQRPNFLAELCRASPDAVRSRPERVMHLLSTAGAPVLYAGYVLNARAASASPLEALPEVPDGILIFFAGSTALYLTGKLARPE